MPHRILDNADDLADFTRFLGRLKLPVTVEWTQGRDRSHSQNQLQWMWAAEVAQQLGDRDAADVQAEWKLRHGIPIMREDSPEFRATYDRYLKPRTYAEKIEAMRDLDIGVTRLMKVRQMIRYLDAIERECAEMGLKVTPPDPALATYQARYRAKTGEAA